MQRNDTYSLQTLKNKIQYHDPDGNKLTQAIQRNDANAVKEIIKQNGHKIIAPEHLDLAYLQQCKINLNILIENLQTHFSFYNNTSAQNHLTKIFYQSCKDNEPEVINGFIKNIPYEYNPMDFNYLNTEQPTPSRQPIQDEQNSYTALHWAVINQLDAVMQILPVFNPCRDDHHSDYHNKSIGQSALYTKDCNGRTPLDLALMLAKNDPNDKFLNYAKQLSPYMSAIKVINNLDANKFPLLIQHEFQFAMLGHYPHTESFFFITKDYFKADYKKAKDRLVELYTQSDRATKIKFLKGVEDSKSKSKLFSLLVKDLDDDQVPVKNQDDFLKYAEEYIQLIETEEKQIPEKNPTTSSSSYLYQEFSNTNTRLLEPIELQPVYIDLHQIPDYQSTTGIQAIFNSLPETPSQQPEIYTDEEEPERKISYA